MSSGCEIEKHVSARRKSRTRFSTWLYNFNLLKMEEGWKRYQIWFSLLLPLYIQLLSCQTRKNTKMINT